MQVEFCSTQASAGAPTSVTPVSDLGLEARGAASLATPPVDASTASPALDLEISSSTQAAGSVAFSGVAAAMVLSWLASALL